MFNILKNANVLVCALVYMNVTVTMYNMYQISNVIENIRRFISVIQRTCSVHVNVFVSFHNEHWIG